MLFFGDRVPCCLFRLCGCFVLFVCLFVRACRRGPFVLLRGGVSCVVGLVCASGRTRDIFRVVFSQRILRRYTEVNAQCVSFVCKLNVHACTVFVYRLSARRVLTPSVMSGLCAQATRGRPVISCFAQKHVTVTHVVCRYLSFRSFFFFSDSGRGGLVGLCVFQMIGGFVSLVKKNSVVLYLLCCTLRAFGFESACST